MANIDTPIAHRTAIAQNVCFEQAGDSKTGGDCNPHIGAINSAHMQGCRTSRGNAFSKKQYLRTCLTYYDKTTSFNQAGNSKSMRSSAVLRNPSSRGKIIQGTTRFFC